MSHARRARRVLAVMACTVVVASAGCRSPFHSFADVARPGAPEAVAGIDRKDVTESAPAVAAVAPPPRPDAPPATADEPAGPVATPLLDAALRRAEAAEEAQRETIREAQAAMRRPAVETRPEPVPAPEAKVDAAQAPEPVPQSPEPAPQVVAEEPPAPAPEPPAPTSIEIKATVAPPAETAPPAEPGAVEPPAQAPADEPRSDPAVQPASAEVAVDEAPEGNDEDTIPPLPGFVTDEAPPAPATEREPTPETPVVAEAPDSPLIDKDGAAAGLTIDAVRLCRKILDFGSYEPLKDRTLRPGRSALVYCELGGLEYRPEGDEFVAKVATRVELVRPADGEKVWEVSDSAVDRRPARRRDVYVGTMVTLPDTVAPGEYTLRLHQVDATSGSTASADIPVTIAR